MSSGVIVSSLLCYFRNVVSFSIFYYVDPFRYIFFQEGNHFLVFLVVRIGSHSGFQCFYSQCEVSNDSFSSTLPEWASVASSRSFTCPSCLMKGESRRREEDKSKCEDLFCSSRSLLSRFSLSLNCPGRTFFFFQTSSTFEIQDANVTVQEEMLGARLPKVR